MWIAADVFSEAAFDWLRAGPEAVVGLKIEDRAKFSLLISYLFYLVAASESRGRAALI